MQHITIYDYLLLPLYLLLFYILVKRRSLRFEDLELRKIFLIAFALRMFGSVAYSMLVQYYYGYGDAFTYYVGGNFIIDQIQADFSNIKYLVFPADELQRLYSLENGKVGGINGWIGISSTVAVMKISAVTSILSFNKFLITSVFFGLFSFAGQWKLFQVFNNINKGKNQKLLAFAVLYTPAIWFWGSGLMKESICMGALGFIISILYNAIVKKRVVPVDWVLLILLVYIIYTIKSYIIAILLITVFFTLLFSLFQKIKLILIRIALTFLTLLIVYFSLTLSDFNEQMNDLAEESVMQIESFQKNYQTTQELDETSKAGFEMSSLNPSFESMLLRSPVVISSCLFRPFIWESRKLIILLSSFESTLLMLGFFFLLIKSRVFGFLNLIFTNHYIFFCFLLSILFATIIGFTTFNFGTMTRYKIVLLPFLYFMLVNIYTKLMEKKKEEMV